MSDLVDALIREKLFGFVNGIREGEWYRLGTLRLRVRDGCVFQDLCFAGGPVLDGDRELAPDELLLMLAHDEPRVEAVAQELRTAIEHAQVTLANKFSLSLKDPFAGERLAATRNRPFHPTARATVGWTADELARYGPMRGGTLGLDWLAVQIQSLKFGAGANSDHLAELLLDGDEREKLGDVGGEFCLLPVHPWQFDHLIHREFAAELNAGVIAVAARGVGRFYPTASLRTLACADPTLHVKVPLAVFTLGTDRLLGPESLASAERSEYVMRKIIRRDPLLSKRVVLCEEQTWCSWSGSKGDTRSGQLSALLRRFPGDVKDAIPMGAFAAHEWDTLQRIHSARPSELLRGSR